MHIALFILYYEFHTAFHTIQITIFTIFTIITLFPLFYIFTLLT